MTLHNGIIASPSFSQIPGLVHGFTTRSLGDMRKKDIREKIISNLLQAPYTYHSVHQIHSNIMRDVGDHDKTDLLQDADGLICQKFDTTHMVGVYTGDCVPILFVDPSAGLVASVHAGWKGTYAEIAKQAVQGLLHKGASISSLFVAIGPHIGACCYAVPEQRAMLFVSKMDDPRITWQKDTQWYLDIGRINLLQLLSLGIPKRHIDTQVWCTSCQHDAFFSYRKDPKETYGEMMGIIGYKT